MEMKLQYRSLKCRHFRTCVLKVEEYSAEKSVSKEHLVTELEVYDYEEED